MIEMLMGVVTLLYTNPRNLEPPLEQSRNTCVAYAMSECGFMETGERLDAELLVDEYGNNIRTIGASTYDFLRGMDEFSGRHITRIGMMQRLRLGQPTIIGVSNFEITKYTFIPGPNKRGHAMCAVGLYEYNNKEYILARNTMGDDKGIMGYFLVDPSVVDEMFSFTSNYGY